MLQVLPWLQKKVLEAEVGSLETERAALTQQTGELVDSMGDTQAQELTAGGWWSNWGPRVNKIQLNKSHYNSVCMYLLILLAFQPIAGSGGF